MSDQQKTENNGLQLEDCFKRNQTECLILLKLLTDEIQNLKFGDETNWGDVGNLSYSRDKFKTVTNFLNLTQNSEN